MPQWTQARRFFSAAASPASARCSARKCVRMSDAFPHAAGIEQAQRVEPGFHATRQLCANRIFWRERRDVVAATQRNGAHTEALADDTHGLPNIANGPEQSTGHVRAPRNRLQLRDEF